VAGDMQGKAIWVNEGRALAPQASTMRGLATSRLLVEDEIRRRVSAIANVTVHTHVDVHSLNVDRSGRVDGAHVSWRDRDAMDEVLHADLVVDASGRGSRAAAWLDQLGYGTPEIQEIVVGLSYTTREFVRTVPDDESSLVICA